MELFTVNRYTEEQKSTPHQNEDEILQRILKKAEKRKRKQSKSVASEVNENEPKPEIVEETAPVTENVPEAADDIGSVIEDVAQSTSTDFQVLGENIASNKRQKVDMVLPPWLAHPTIISTSIVASNAEDSDISKLPYIAPHTRHALKEMNITRLFPVQMAVIPWILDAHAMPPPFRPRDICVSAPTGSGKTLAFAVPIVQLLSTRVQRKIRALVVLPVAELALQVFKVFKTLCDKTDLKVCLLSKQFPFAMEQGKLIECYKGEYYANVDIIVTTPGRLVDHLHATKGFCLKALRFLVIDEADRIMDAVFQNWLYHLDAHVRVTSDQLLSGRAPPLCYRELEISAATQPHKLLFSATLSQDPEKLQNLRLFQPKLFTSVLASLDELREKFTMASNDEKEPLQRGQFIGKYTTPAELSEKYCITEDRIKPLTLFGLIMEHGWKKFLCFTNSADASARLAFVLNSLLKETQQKIVINDLSAALSATNRATVLSNFTRGLVNGVVCSDALARGIDIPHVDVVISYDLPRHIKTYIHRIGRTARAGTPGTAITLLTQKEQNIFNQTLAEVGKVITAEISVASDVEEIYANAYTKALQSLRQKLEFDKRQKLERKERIKENASIANKDPKTMSLMEQLQLDAHKQVVEKVEKKFTTALSAKRNASKTYKRKKFNASAGKSKAIIE